MDYLKIYQHLISSRKARVPQCDVHYEKHHIVMRSMGGSDDNENLVLLTPREHYIAHFLLWRIHRNGKTAWAFKMMCTRTKKWSSRMYESEKMKQALSGRTWSDEAKQRVRGENSHRFGVTFKHSDDTKKKIGDIHRGRKHSPETIENNRIRHIGKTASESTKNKMSNTRLKLAVIKRRPVLQYDLMGNLIKEWNSPAEIFKTTNVHQGNISLCCNGKRNSTAGFIWKWKNNMSV